MQKIRGGGDNIFSRTRLHLYSPFAHPLPPYIFFSQPPPPFHNFALDPPPPPWTDFRFFSGQSTLF